jgi:enediyne biosynthesis protein E4
VKLIGGKSNRDGLGAKICLTLADGRKLYNHAATSVGYASSSEKLVRFGLAAQDRATTIEVQWPGGRTQVIQNVAVDRVLEIREGP